MVMEVVVVKVVLVLVIVGLVFVEKAADVVVVGSVMEVDGRLGCSGDGSGSNNCGCG